ncbi:MAG TPA: aminodeoxychorismate/anthranilate synthase component II [Crocinitomicaceae bacterium]|nr:aminodeoxychorismate/anthranilate synthase component II [Flavobacteriales bacterium]HBW86702.1 aminodeoxychorismate/anthranilate synthase component II [Crocinitomicaceae bacterium]
MVLVVDFYDSFTFNLVHYFENAGEQVEIVCHDNLFIESLIKYSLVVLSPGPGLPQEKENMFECIAFCHSNKIPLFGVCLGFQALAIFLGGELINQKKVKHGVSESLASISKESVLLFGIPIGTAVGLYHSWKICGLDKKYITAISVNQIAMSLESKHDKIFGVQFHPESILTQKGMSVIQNLVNWKNHDQ